MCHLFNRWLLYGMRPIIIAAAVVLAGFAVTNPGKEDYAGWAKNQMAKQG
jgi:hypothetical protein